MVAQVYRARKPKASPLWQCLWRHFDRFLEVYEERYQPRYGYLRPIIPEVVHKFLNCGDLERGFARIRCEHCKHEYLLALSCISYYTSSVLSDIRAVFRSFPASASSYMQSPWSLSLRYPTGKVPFARLTRTIREVVPSFGATSSAVK